MKRTHSEYDYRARATKAEQENARLREELAKKPNFEWFVEQIYAMLKVKRSVTINNVIQQVKVLRDNQDMYRSASSVVARKDAKAHDAEILAKGRRIGMRDAADIITSLIEKEK